MQPLTSRLENMCRTVVVLSFCLLLGTSSARLLTETNEENCEVCVKFLSKFVDNLPAEAKGDPGKIQTEFLKTCKTAKKSDNRFCYYLGGTEDAATSILGDLTKPLSWGMPANKVCLKLYRQDQQICDLRYEKSLDLVNTNLKKLKVKDLKKILGDWDDSCRGCTEKTDYIRRIEELMPKYAPEAAAARAAKSEL